MKSYKLKYGKIEKAVVGAYKRIENAVVGTYKRIENAFVKTFLEEAADEKSAKNSKKTC